MGLSGRKVPLVWRGRPEGPVGMRWCPKCGEFKALSLFGPRGIRAYCQPCDRHWQEQRRRLRGVPPKFSPIPLPPGMRWCRSCSTGKPISEFGHNRRQAWACLACINAKMATRRGGYKIGPRGRRKQLPVSSGQRRCTKCEGIKPLEAFRRNKVSGKFDVRCRLCRACPEEL